MQVLRLVERGRCASVNALSADKWFMRAISKSAKRWAAVAWCFLEGEMLRRRARWCWLADTLVLRIGMVETLKLLITLCLLKRRNSIVTAHCHVY